MAPKLISKLSKNSNKDLKNLKKTAHEYQKFIKKILNMWVKILHMKLGQYIIIVAIEKKVFLELFRKKI